MKINVKHNFNLDKVLKRVERQMPNLLNDQLGIIQIDVEAGIEAGRDINGRPFKKLKPSTIKAKRKKKSPHPSRALHDTGKMKFTYTKQQATAANPTAILKVADKRSEAITGFKYGVGQIQHEGSKRIPARPWFGISKRAKKKMEKARQQQILKALGKEWKLV